MAKPELLPYPVPQMKGRNTFTVDLGNLKISDAQRQNINSAIQKAVSNELASISNLGRIGLVPITKWIGGPIINGIIARRWTKSILEGR